MGLVPEIKLMYVYMYDVESFFIHAFSLRQQLGSRRFTNNLRPVPIACIARYPDNVALKSKIIN